jgi:nitrile hydratase accessory protein
LSRRNSQPFEEPWQAQALAIAQSLQDSGVITAAQWSQALGAAIARAQAAGDPDRGDTYYLHVLDALEHLLAENDLVSRDALQARKSEWEAAYRRTPHGQPVEL